MSAEFNAIAVILATALLSTVHPSAQFQTELHVTLLTNPVDRTQLFCALDPPSKNVTLPYVMTGLGDSVPPMVLCAYQCTSDRDGCRQFNFLVSDVLTCQLYNYLPVNFGPRENCFHHMLPG